MKSLFKNTDLRKLFYGIGIITLILMAMLYLILDNGEPPAPNKPIVKDSAATAFSQNRDVTGYLLKVILVTFFIIVVLIVGAKWYGKLNRINGADSFIKILSKQHLGPKQFLMLIAVEQKKILIGVTENSINHVMDMGEYKSSEDITPDTINNKQGFSTLLNYFRKGEHE